MEATLYPITAAAPNRIAIVARPRGGDWLLDELSALAGEGIDVLVSMLTDEEANELELQRESEGCLAPAISFVNLPIPDRSVPLDRDDFLQQVEQLAEMVQKGRFVGVHCRASIGGPRYLWFPFSCNLDGTPKTPSMRSSRHVAVRFQTQPNKGNGFSRTSLSDLES